MTGVFDGGTDPGTAADALALEGEEPAPGIEADALGDQAGGEFGFDGVGVGGGLRGGSGAGADEAGFAGHDGAAGDGVRSE